jgi:aminopeptidase N
LAPQPKAGEARDFHIRYSGEPDDGLTFGTTRAGGRAFVTWNWPTKIRNWAPTLDHVSSKVTSEWVVTAPETYSVVANGLMQSEVSLGDGRKTTHWRQSVPISPWLNAFMVARFQVFYGGTERGIPMQLWAPVGDKVDVANGMLVQRRTIDFSQRHDRPLSLREAGRRRRADDGRGDGARQRRLLRRRRPA